MRQVGLGMAGLVMLACVIGGAWAASPQAEVRATFSPEDRKIIKGYYAKDIVEQARDAAGATEGRGKGKKGLPPGLAKREKLPPGLQRQLERNGTLPPGLQKRLEPLPPNVERRLEPLPPNQTRVVVGTDVIILDKTSQKILDIIRDVATLHRDIAK